MGQGSFSRVYLADDSRWKGNLVALKQIRTEHLSEREYALLNGQFLQEAAMLMSLSHSGLPRVVEFFAEASCYYLALQWIAGHNLQELVQARTQVSESEVLQWGIEMCTVLEYLHAQRPYPILLGDLKPANVISCFDGHLKIVDFGVARHLSGHQSSEFALVSPGFSPPEQYLGRPLDERSDIYSLGATLYWLLQPVALARYRFDIPTLRKLRPDASRGLEELLQRCLARQHSARPASVAEVRQELEEIGRALSQQKSTPSEILSALYRQKKKGFSL